MLFFFFKTETCPVAPSDKQLLLCSETRRALHPHCLHAVLLVCRQVAVLTQRAIALTIVSPTWKTEDNINGVKHPHLTALKEKVKAITQPQGGWVGGPRLLSLSDDTAELFFKEVQTPETILTTTDTCCALQS